MSNKAKKLKDAAIENCTGGQNAFQHNVSGKVLETDQVKKAAEVVAGKHLQDGTIDPNRFPWSPIESSGEE